MTVDAPSETTRRPTPMPNSVTRRSRPYVGALESVLAKMTDLRQLEADWNGYGAARIDREAIFLAVRFAETAIERGFPAPEVFPLPDGGVQLEWAAGPMEVEFEVEPGARTAIFVADDRATGKRFDGELPGDQGLFTHAMANLMAYVNERRGC